MRRFDFAAALAAGFIVLFAGALVGQLSAISEWPAPNLEYWLHRYQTLAVSIVAIISLVGVSHQINATRRQTRAALLASHKQDFAALSLVKNLFITLKHHIAFRLDFTIRNVGAGATTPPPQVAVGDIESIRRALIIPGEDPFLLVSIHDEWATAVSQYRSGALSAEELLSVAEYVVGNCDLCITQAMDMIDTLHKQIDESL